MPVKNDLQNEDEKAYAQAELRRQKRDMIKRQVKRKGAGATAQASGASMQVAGKAANLAGKGVSTAGKGVSSGGNAMMRMGAGLSGTGIGALAGIPLAALGGAVSLGGAGVQVGGKAVSASGKVVDKAGKIVRKSGKNISKGGSLRQNKLASMKRIEEMQSSVAKIAGKIPGLNVIPVGKKTIIIIVLIPLLITGLSVLVGMYVSSLSLWDKFKLLIMLKS